jgi:hypothetical protein
LTAALDAGALLRRLHEAGVSHVVIGGFAVIAHGVQRFTNDLDICPDPERDNLTRLAGLVADLGAEQVGIEDFAAEEFPFDPSNPDELAEGGNFRLVTPIGVLDIMQWLPGIEGDHAYPVLATEALEGQVFGIPVRVCSLRHLRLMKEAAGRPQDRRDLEDLALAHGPAESG